MPTIKLGDLRNAFDFVSFGSPYENNAYIARESGEFFFESELTEEAEDLPDDLGDSERYIAVPHRNELELGKRLALGFVDRELPGDSGEVESFFRAGGAYARFKALLEERGRLEDWYAHEERATLAALLAWGEEAEVEIVDEPAGPD